MPNLVTDMNRQRLAFTAHDGDLKQGSNSPCDDALYENSLATLNSLEAPAVFTPGDNDWTDCDRPNNGGYNSLERLNHERKAGGGEHEATCASRAGGLEQHGGAADVDRRVERRIGDRAADVDLGG